MGVAILGDREPESLRSPARAHYDGRPRLELADPGAPSWWARHGGHASCVECAGATACVCAVWSPWRASQLQHGGTPRYRRGLLEGGWDCPGKASSPLTGGFNPQNAALRLVLGPPNFGGSRHPSTSASGPGPDPCLWVRCTPRLSWLLCCTSVCRCGIAVGWGSPGPQSPGALWVLRTRHSFPAICKIES